MPRFINFDTPFTAQMNLNFDNGPGSSDKGSYLDDVDFDAGQVFDTGSVVRATVNQNGHVYNLALAYNSLYRTASTLTLSVDGQAIEVYEQLNLSLDTLFLYEGDALLQIIFGGTDSIYGASNGDRLFGYEGNDSIYGRGGDDWINGGGGTDFIDGGDGRDTAEFAYAANNYGLSRRHNGEVEVVGVTGIRDRLVSIEQLKFSDKLVEASALSYIGTSTDIVSVSGHDVYRFYNTLDKAFFYTASASEKDSVIVNSLPGSLGAADNSWPYVYQGSTFEKAHTYGGATPLFRFYNRETGHHFFTVSKAEADAVRVKAASGEWPFNYEGAAFNVYANDPTPNSQGSEVAVHRFYSSQMNRHFYTANETEVQEIRLTGQWSYEGIGFWGEV